MFVSTRMKRKTSRFAARRHVFQDYKLLEDRTVFDNIALGMRITGATLYQIKRRVTSLLNEVGLFHKRFALPHTLSGGEQ
jgi:cell division transport system ATP-binding protein